jgi:acyl-CoA thioesterase-1
VIPLVFLGVAAENHVLELNARIPLWALSLSTRNSPIWIVDQHANFTAGDFRDGLHPNKAGDRKMAARWYPVLAKAVHLVQSTRKEPGMQIKMGT